MGIPTRSTRLVQQVYAARTRSHLNALPSAVHHVTVVARHPVRFAWQVLRAFRANQGLLLAGAVAYYALLSIVPLLILSVIALSHWVEAEELLATMAEQLQVRLCMR